MTSASFHLQCASPLRIRSTARGLALLALLCMAPQARAQSLSMSAGASTSGASATAGAAAPATPEAGVPAAAAAPAETGPIGRDAQAWDLVHRGYNTWDGSTGGLFIDDPGMAERGSLRLQLGLDFFTGKDVLYSGDEVEQNRQTLSMSWTALQALEIYASIQNRSVTANLPTANSLSALGDFSLGFKLGAEAGKLVRLGGGLRTTVPSGMGNEGTSLDALSFGLRANGALDLQGLDSPVPLIVRLSLDYLFDNSAQLVQGIEDKRYRRLQDADPRNVETRHLVTRVERFGLGINRVDTFSAGLGLEAPLEIPHDVFVHPMLEYRVGISVNRQGFDCAFDSSLANRGTSNLGAKNAVPDDTCLADAGAGFYPMDLALGVRLVPPVRGLSIVAGVDFALKWTETFVRELAPAADIKLLVGLSYDYDARPSAPVAASAPVGPPPAPPKGRLVGRVTDQASGQPIAGAVLRITGSDLTPLASDDAGRFTSFELDPGDVELSLTHPDYEARRCAATIPAVGGNVEMTCTMAALPIGGSIKGTLRDQFGASLSGARIQLTGPSSVQVTTDSAGEFVASDLSAGEYTARVDADSQLIRVVRVAVAPRQQSRVDIAVTARPAKSGVVRLGDEMAAKNLRFAADSSELSPAAAQAVVEIADALLRDSSTRRLRIECDGAEGLALMRALTIKQRIVDAGVPDSRLEAAGEPGSRVKLTVIE